MAGKNEWLPWYRRKGYKGNLTEEDKRILDSFRMKERHPAVRCEQLPDEAQGYINRLELELYDKKQESAAGKALLLAGVAAFSIWYGFKGYGNSSPLFSYLVGALLLVIAWVGYRWEWNKNASEFCPKDEDSADATDEELRYEWELMYIVSRKRKKKMETESDEWASDA